MAKSNRCSTCQKQAGAMHCIGCDAYFCAKDFRGHREILFNEMDGLFEERNNLQDKINKATQHNDSRSPLIEEINKWEKATIEKVHQVAEHARQQAFQLLTVKRVKIANEFKGFSEELADLKETENFVEQDLERLKQLILQFHHDLTQLTQPVTIELNTKESNGIDWNRVIYVQEKSINVEHQQLQQQTIDRNGRRNSNESLDMYDDNYQGEGVDHLATRGPPLETLVNICPQPPYIQNMEDMPANQCVFMIKPFKYNPANPKEEPTPINYPNPYIDRWDEHHVRMPCSPSNVSKNGQPRWPIIRQLLVHLKQKCDHGTATVESLKRTIESCVERHYNIDCLEHLINEIYSTDKRLYFMTTVLSNICSLALNVEFICGRSPPLLFIGSNQSVTMSQRQAASLLACAFFCLFPYRSDSNLKKEYGQFPNPNFNTLYQRGDIQKVEKLKCILHYFERITEKMPNGVITFRRRAVPNQFSPKWSKSEKGLAPMHLTTAKKIEDINCTLQVDFANKYIGGGVLGSDCVQEEIRFVICPEMLVSLLLCQVMETNECIYLIGCERYSSYKGYSSTFQYAGDFIDEKPKDSWGRKWCHLVAIDAIDFRDRSVQYQMKYIDRELMKAYTGFYTRGQTQHGSFPITTGNWVCEAFNGDRQLKAIIQLMAASESVRSLIYAAYGDKNLIESFAIVYDYLIGQRAVVRDLYRYLHQYSKGRSQISLFDFIRKTPVSSLAS